MTTRLLLTILTSFFLLSVTAQDTGLKLTKLNRKAKVKIVQLGKELIVQKLGSTGKEKNIKGTFETLTADYIVVGGETIPIDSISYIIQPYKNILVWKILAIPAAGIGVLYTGISGLFIVAGAIFNDNVYVIGGTIDLLIGMGIIVGSLYPYYTKGKKFKIGTKWMLEPIGVGSGEDDYYRSPID